MCEEVRDAGLAPGHLILAMRGSPAGFYPARMEPGHHVESPQMFVGRAVEVAQLRAQVAGLDAGVGGVLLIEGEQGIGKSSLLRAGLAGVNAEYRVAWGAAEELGQRFPLRLMADCWGTQGWLSDGEDGPPGVLAGNPVLGAVERLLAMVDRLCAASPVLLVAEDLQWADELSLLVWHRLALVVRQLPLLVVGSCRTVLARAELAHVRRSVRAGGGTVLTLGPLATGEVAELTAGLTGGQPGPRLEDLLARAGGNPLYVRELADSLVRDSQLRVTEGIAELAGGPARVGVPASLAAAIAERLDGLDDGALDVLRWAAVLGQEFSVTDLEVVYGKSPVELMGLLRQALAAGVLAEAGSRLEFRHGLIRQSLYEGMPQSLRAALHRQAARRLSEGGGTPEQVLSHLALAPADDSAWAYDWLARAAPVLTSRAPQVTAELLRGAVTRLAAGDPRRLAIQISLMKVALLLEQYREVERIGGEALGRADDPDLAAEVSWLVAYAQQRDDRPEVAAGSLAQALERPLLTEVWAARLRATHAMTLFLSGAPDRADEVARAALAAGRRLGDKLATAYALHALSYFDNERDTPAGLGYIDAAIDVIGDDPELADLRLLLLSNRLYPLDLLDRHAEANTAIQEALTLAERIGTHRLKWIRLAAGEYYFDAGRWDDAQAELEAPVALAPRTSYILLREHGLAALIAGHRGDQVTAARHLAATGTSEIAAVTQQLLSALHLLLARALAAEQAGRPEQAMGVLAVCLDPDIAAIMEQRITLLPTLTRLALAIGDTATAAAAAAAAAAEAEREPLPVKTAAASFCQGLVTREASPLLAAASYYQATERPLKRAQALEDAAVALAAGADLAAARDAFATAVALYRGLGAEWDVRRTEARLRPAGIRPGRSRASAGLRRRASHGWESLTPAEAKIVRLIAEGRSNPDIAAELFLSRNTVQTHVSHVLAKLGARSRGEIIREALQRMPSSQTG
jgi:DNA-binding CsgD family transcriptional regulator